MHVKERLRPACVDWLKTYHRRALTHDLTAGLVVTLLLLPQAVAYAMLAGLPPEAGLYASILPLLAYAVFGSSRTLAVGPVALIALMTGAALGGVAEPGTGAYWGAAMVLALLSGVILLVMGLLGLGFLTNFLSHPVVTGFVTASVVLIAASQLPHLLGAPAAGFTLPEIARSTLPELADHLHLPTVLVGFGALGLLVGARWGLEPALRRAGFPEGWAVWTPRTAPAVVVLGATAISWALELKAHGVAVVGPLASGMPALAFPGMSTELVLALLSGAVLISMVTFVESVSVARNLAAKRRQRVEPDQELLGLGTANVAASVSGGFPVAGGFSRSVVNFEAGAATPAAGAFAAAGVVGVALYATPVFTHMPVAALAAAIIVAVVGLIEPRDHVRVWNYSRPDAAALAVTTLATLLLGVEVGLASGVAVSLALYLHRTSRPHWALLGRIPGTEHFRNVQRHHRVETDPRIAFLRIDESFYFANARFLEDVVLALPAEQPHLEHVVLVCPAVNAVDVSALESLEMVHDRLRDAGIRLHLAEVKGPVRDALRDTRLLEELSGQVFLSAHEAWKRLKEGQRISALPYHTDS